VADDDGSSSISSAGVTLFLLTMANNIATLAAKWNAIMGQTGLSDLTDNSSGTAADTLVANPAPAAANGAATTSSPKAGFDTQLAAIENNISDIGNRLNVLLKKFGKTPFTDNTGVSPDTTIEALGVNLSAVDGSSGTSAVDQASARARMATINNAVSSLAAGIAELAPYFGVEPLKDNLGGTVSKTLANIAATATGVGGSTGTPTLLDSEVDTWLSHNRDNIASLVAKLNEMTGTDAQPTKPLSVIAG
jgi:hypothetical protein